jgi:hypothetical protein
MRARTTLLTAGLVVLHDRRGTTQASGGSRERAPVERDAKQVIDLLKTRQFAKLIERWDAGMRETLPARRVAEFWSRLVAQVGALQSVGAAGVMSEGPYRTVVLPLSFERAELAASVTYDAGGRVAGVYFTPMI